LISSVQVEIEALGALVERNKLGRREVPFTRKRRHLETFYNPEVAINCKYDLFLVYNIYSKIYSILLYTVK